MPIFPEQLQPVAVGSQENRVEALRLLLGYPLKQRDPEGSRFWFLRPGVDESEAEDTCPIAVGFYSELNHLSKDEILQFFTADEQQNEIYGHYTDRIVPNQPVMYLLLPDGDLEGRVAMVLPSEGKLRRRQIQSFGWTEQDLQARLNRLRQSELARTDRMQEKALSVIPLVEWAFYKPIETAKELAEKLAEVSRKIEQAIPIVYDAERSDGYLHSLLTSFQRELLPTLKLKADNDKDYSFADIYAQTISYGLFTARVFSYTIDERKRQEAQNPERKERDFNRQNAWERLPETNPFLRRLFRDVSQQPISELGEDLADAISEVFSILRAAKMDAILADFRAKMNREDIVIRFYEDFLTAYKPKMRERRGVYYTPEPVVSYMVRSVDILLKEKFDKPLGLADPEVMILDPACGTGTFLLWIFQEIYRKFQENPELLTVGLEDKSWSGYVKERLLPRIFGFELLMAPYAIAHLKLGLFLEETGYQFDSGKRLGVYLTNSLENATRKSETLFEQFIAQEADQAVDIKREKPVMVITGNPPYSVSSSNKSKFIEDLMERYKQAVRTEKNIQPLSDDYIKFIRLAHHQIEQTGYGLIGLITNHSFLNGLTHRGMREELLKGFSELYFLDLHGNSLIGEVSTNQEVDQNVFDIQQGVSIIFAIRKVHKPLSSKVFHCDLYGSRNSKYKSLEESTINSTKWISLSPSNPNYFLSPKDLTTGEEYFSWWSLSKIFLKYAVGVRTRRDYLMVDQARDSIVQRFKNIASDSDLKRLKELYRIKDTPYWNLANAKKSIKLDEVESKVRRYSYRPFDQRWAYYNPKIIERGDDRWGLMQHMVKLKNLGIYTCRQSISNSWRHILVTDDVTDDCYVSNKSRERGYLFPLHIASETVNDEVVQDDLFAFSAPNLSKDFLEEVSQKIGYSPTPESIFFYIYAILNSSVYRTRYAEFLKIDFPRIPLISNDDLFHQLAKYGEELVALHLMKSPKLDTLITQFVDAGGDRTVDPGHPKYEESSSSVLINKKGDKFTGVPKAVWEFYVGGYQVCQKWLKDRKGRTLSSEDITHYQRIVVALQETMRLMQQIDEAIPEFPIE